MERGTLLREFLAPAKSEEPCPALWQIGHHLRLSNIAKGRGFGKVFSDGRLAQWLARLVYTE